MGWSFTPPNQQAATFEYQGNPTPFHADGNNVAWICPKCKHPVLFVYQNGRAGSSPADQTICQGPGCGAQYSLHPPYTRPEPPGSQTPSPVMDIV